MKPVFGILLTILVGYICFQFASDFGLDSPWFALEINWFLMFWAYSIGKLVSLRLPLRYYEPFAFKKGGAIHSMLGKKVFRQLLRRVSNRAFDMSKYRGRRRENI